MSVSKLTRFLAVFLVLVMSATAVLTGCGANNGTDKGTTPKNEEQNVAGKTQESQLAPYEIKWKLAGAFPQAKMQDVVDEINKKVKEKINATVKFDAMDWGSYDQKIKMSMAAQEEFDLCFTSSWVNNFYLSVAKEAYLPLDGLLEKNAQNIMKIIPQFGWDAVKVKGQIFAIPNYQIWAMTNGFGVPKDLADKYSLKPETIKKIEDLEPFLEAVKNGEKDIIPIGAGFFSDVGIALGFDAVQHISVPGAVYLNDATCQVVNQFDTKEVKAFVYKMRDWYQKGYIASNAATNPNVADEIKAGKYALTQAGNVKPGGEADIQSKFGKESYQIAVADPYLTTSSIIATLTAVSATSKDPARALMFYDMLFADKELYRLLSFGIENVNYKKVDEETVEMIKDSGYDPNMDWAWGNQFNAFYRAGQKPGIWEETIKINETAKPSPLLGFSFNPDVLKTELASVATAIDMWPMLACGAVDPDKYYPEFLDKLKKAGIDNLIAGMQKQVDDWKEKKVK